MNLPALARFAEFCEENKLSSALLSNPATITWLTGYAAPIQTGPNPFEGGTALGWCHDGQFTLLLSDGESGAARSLGIDTRDYVAYSIEGPAAGFRNQATALKELLSGSGQEKSRVGLELNFLPAPFLEVVKDALASVNIVMLDSRLDVLRAVKSPDEVDQIRAALALCDLAQAETVRLLRPGVNEIELWTQVKGSMEIAAGSRLPVLADLIAGSRTAEIGGLPGDYILAEGDAVIADIVPRLNGYWGDNCGTHFVGEPSADLRKMYHAVLGALCGAIAVVRPGVRACDLDTQLRNAIRNAGYPMYPHHSGHGLGTTYHEEPRIVPYNEQPLQPGMVIALEPGVYLPGIGGIRLEDVLHVTQDGCEVLTKHLANA